MFVATSRIHQLLHLTVTLFTFQSENETPVSRNSNSYDPNRAKQDTYNNQTCTEKNSFVTASKLGTTNKMFVVVTKNFCRSNQTFC